MTEERERGRKEGRIDALLDEHTKHLGEINGRIERFTASLDALRRTVREGIDTLSSAIRTLQEEGRSAKLALEVAARTLATETERRRAELETAGTTIDRKFTKRQQVAALLLALVALIATIYFSMPHG